MRVVKIECGWPVLELHKVEDIDATANEEELHNGVVQRYEAEEEVKVTRDEDSHVETLCFEWYAWMEKRLAGIIYKRLAWKYDQTLRILRR